MYLDGISNFVAAVKSTLAYWVDIHTDPQMWAKAQILMTPHDNDDEASYFMRERGSAITFGRGSAAVNMAEQLVRRHAAKKGLFACTSCHGVYYGGEECFCDELAEETGEESESNFLPVAELTDCQWVDIWFMLEDVYNISAGADPVSEEFVLGGSRISVETYLEILAEVAFPVYRQWVVNGFDIDSYVMQISDAWRDINSADTVGDLLAAAMQGTQIYHVHGEVIADYGKNFGLAYSEVDEIRNDGIAAFFGEEEAEEWLASDFADIDAEVDSYIEWLPVSFGDEVQNEHE